MKNEDNILGHTEEVKICAKEECLVSSVGVDFNPPVYWLSRKMIEDILAAMNRVDENNSNVTKTY